MQYLDSFADHVNTLFSVMDREALDYLTRITVSFPDGSILHISTDLIRRSVGTPVSQYIAQCVKGQWLAPTYCLGWFVPGVQCGASADLMAMGFMPEDTPFGWWRA